MGEVCNLTQDPFFKNAPVKVTTVTSTSFTFTTLPGHFDPVGSTITFSTYVSGGNVYLRQTGWWNIHDPGEWAKAEATQPVAFFTWQKMSDNLREYASLNQWLRPLGLAC